MKLKLHMAKYQLLVDSENRIKYKKKQIMSQAFQLRSLTL